MGEKETWDEADAPGTEQAKAAKPKTAGEQRLANEPPGSGGPEAAEGSIVKSKSNITNNRLEEAGSGAATEPAESANLDPSNSGAARASNLNLSKSNIDRLAGEDPAPEAAINTSHSNIKNLVAGDDPTPEAAINNTKSNIKGLAATVEEPPPESAINNSHSNIKNLRTAAGDPGAAEAAANLNASKSNID